MITCSNLFVKRDRKGNPIIKDVNKIPSSEDIRVVKFTQDGLTGYKFSVRDWGFTTYSLLDTGLDEEVFVNLELEDCEVEIKPLSEVLGFEDINEYELYRSHRNEQLCRSMLLNIESTMNFNEAQKKQANGRVYTRPRTRVDE